MTAPIPPVPTFVRAHDRRLSLWQSAVAETVKRRLGTGDANAVLAHPLTQAVNRQVAAYKLARAGAVAAAPADDGARLAALAFEFATGVARADHDPARLRQLFADAEVPFSDDDYKHWATCVTTYDSYADEGYAMLYNDWTVAGGNDLNYGVIDYTVPAGGKVAIIGDWGTGLDDAQCLLDDIVANHAPDAIIHLGDIYYSGTPGECTDAFTNILNAAYDGKRNTPVFTIPGNHDYYSFGYGFYGMLPGLNNNIPCDSTQSAMQPASYFCLRTADNAWQFLAMDTGFNDCDPLNAENPDVAGPAVQPNEVAWHLDKLEHFPGGTILLSHHQVFSAYAKINGETSAVSYLPYINTSLYGAFSDYFATTVALWLWGHEHNLAIYPANLWGLAKGRLVGCSAYEEFVSSDPYGWTFKQVPESLVTLDQTQVAGQAFYDHAYAIIDFSGDAPSIDYYQYPAFYTGSPPSGGGTQIYSETFAAPNLPLDPVASGADMLLLGQEALYVGPVYQGDLQNYPTLVADQADAIQLTFTAVDGGATLSDGDLVHVQSTEAVLGDANYVSSLQEGGSCYYLANGSGCIEWYIRKKSTANGTTVNARDAVYFVDPHSGDSPQILRSDPDDGSLYLTTGPTPYYWRLMPA